MSLLGNQVFANSATPIWASSGGGGGGTSLNIIDASGALVGSYRAGVTSNNPVTSGIQADRIGFTRTGLVPNFDSPPTGNFASYIDISSAGATDGGYDFWNVGGWMAARRITAPGNSFFGRTLVSAVSGEAVVSGVPYITSNSHFHLTAVNRGAPYLAQGIPVMDALDVSGGSFTIKLRDISGNFIIPTTPVQVEWLLLDQYGDLPKPFF